MAALVLAAGQSRRMGANKLLARRAGVSMIETVVATVLASRARPIVVVTGHESATVQAALRDVRGLEFVDNPDHLTGLASSVIRGIEALPPTVPGVLMCLGDMPEVVTDDLDRLIAAFESRGGRVICVPVFAGRRGNPVLMPRGLFPEMRCLTGDVGARALIARHASAVCEVSARDPGVLSDVDTPAALAAWGGTAPDPRGEGWV